ncbi:hypothetical protein H2203_002035 [Taxawa tesnikishii (nom. ined.)]|nr:hypothetical protein H2203_002035 [Dothideales sp. JES 119]
MSQRVNIMDVPRGPKADRLPVVTNVNVLKRNKEYQADAGNYLKWEGIDITVTGKQIKPSNAKIVIRLHHTKGRKGGKDSKILRNLEPFPDGMCQHVSSC